MHKLGLVTIATLALGLTTAQAGPLDPHTIVVSGYAEIQVKPDHATVDIGVVTSDKITAKALQANNVEMQRVVAAIKALGIPDDAMQTSDFSISALHPKVKGSYDEDDSITLGYEVTNKVSVSVSDLEKVADIIDAAVNAGANSSNSVNFWVKNNAANQDRALAAAVRDARHNAEIMASAEHTNVGKMIAMTNMRSEFGPPPAFVPPPDINIAGVMARVPVLPGQITINASVTVTFAIE